MTGVTTTGLADNPAGSIRRPGKNVSVTIPTVGWSDPVSLQGYTTGSFTVPSDWDTVQVQGGSTEDGPFGEVTSRSGSTDAAYGAITVVKNGRFYLPSECFADSHVRFQRAGGTATPVVLYLKS